MTENEKAMNTQERMVQEMNERAIRKARMEQKRVEQKREWDKENMMSLTCRVRKDVGQKFHDLAVTLRSSRHEILASFVKDICDAFPELTDSDLNRCVRSEEKRRMVIALVEPELLDAFDRELVRQCEEKNEVLNKLIRSYVYRSR